MKLDEKKEVLPLDFMTSFVSKGWEEVGNLKASINGIKDNFTVTDKVEEILQELLDAYLIAIGRMENQLNKKNYIELPNDEELKEDLKEDFSEAPEKVSKMNDGNKVELHTELPDYDVEVEQKGDKIEIELDPKEVDEEDEKEIKKELPDEPFEYFVDFDEPELATDEPSMHDAWINH